MLFVRNRKLRGFLRQVVPTGQVVAELGRARGLPGLDGADHHSVVVLVVDGLSGYYYHLRRLPA